jgi:two-component system, chemotaxis family, chemotaxis protein CheY
MHRKALVVDDSGTIRAILRDILSHFDFEVHEAEDGASALDWLQKNGPVDVTCLDWNMPNMTGIQVVRYVRSDPKFKDMPILMCTSETELERVMEALREGANEYIMKPFDQEAIGEKLTMMGILS